MKRLVGMVSIKCFVFKLVRASGNAAAAHIRLTTIFIRAIIVDAKRHTPRRVTNVRHPHDTAQHLCLGAYFLLNGVLRGSTEFRATFGLVAFDGF